MLVRTTRVKSSTGVEAVGPYTPETPALFTQMSSPPRRRASSRRNSTSASSAVSQRSPDAVIPSARSRAAAASASAADRDARTTAAPSVPSSPAIAKPRPREDPVTTATRPRRSPCPVCMLPSYPPTPPRARAGVRKDGGMTIARTVLLFALAAVAEIGGAWMIWQAVREGRAWWWAGIGIVALGLYGFVATLQPDAHFGRILAAYGGVFVVGSLAWGMVADDFKPDRWDVTGALVCLLGVALIMYGPRPADA